jgi:SNF2 family DNA or RNA helicase
MADRVAGLKQAGNRSVGGLTGRTVVPAVRGRAGSAAPSPADIGMTALHAAWSEPGHLLLWGEASALAANLRPARRKASSGWQQHPFGLIPAALGPVLKTCSISVRTLPGAVILLLPSDGRGPVPSPELVVETERPGVTKQSLRPWAVSGLVARDAAGLDLLLALPTDAPPGIVFGASLRFWIVAARFARELVGRQCFVPALVAVEFPERRLLRGVWEAQIGGADRQRLMTLAHAMPPVCRARAEPPDSPKDWAEVTGADQPAAEELLTSFLNQAVDDSVRAALPRGWGAKQSPRALPPETQLAQQWLRSLGSGAAPKKRKSTARVGRASQRSKGKGQESKCPEAEPAMNDRCEIGTLVGAEPDVERFSAQVQAWLANVRPQRSDAAFRLCLRLTEPTAAPTNGESWRLDFLLQATDDPSLLVPSDQVWQAKTGVATFLKRRFENPQERLLAELGRASRVYPLVDQGLETACPAGMALRTEQAYEFLRQSAPLLEQSGFGVLVPPWWQKPTARVSARLRVKSPAETGVTSGLLGRNGIVAYQWQIAIGDESISWTEFQKLAQMKVPLVKVRGQWVELRRDEVEKAIAFFERRRTEGEMALGDALRLGLGQEVSELGLPISGIDAEGAVGTLLDRLTGAAGLEPVAVPPQFRGELRPYQVRGLSWLGFLSQLGLGACLADDMGLGKTIQLIALILHERRQTNGPTLVVCPMSVVGNWQREIARFAPKLKVLIHHGSERLTGVQFERRARKHDVVVTTYALALRDEAVLAAVPWNRVVLDEAQNIKSASALQARAVKRLPARHRIAMTGTPVENRLAELWSIMDFLNPGYLGNAREFRSRFAQPIEKYRDPERAGTLRRLIQPYVLRRLKTDRTIIKDLPQKIETRVYCHLTPEQATLYEAVVKEMLGQIDRTEGIQRRGLVLATLMKLKQICNHPAQFIQDGSALAGRSGKLARLEAMIEELLSEGDQALIFTQFAEMGKMLRRRLQQTANREVLFLHGGTPKRQRDAMVERFQQGEPALFVLSIKAGGLGLNLTAANHVFHFDRWWNPAVENQATDRAFRIGQRRNVQVHKFVCVGTIEERIDQMIEQKKELADVVVGAGEGWITELSTTQLRELFALSRSAALGA